MTAKDHTPCKQAETVIRLDERVKSIEDEQGEVSLKCYQHHKMAHAQDTEITALKGDAGRAKDDIKMLFKRSSPLKQYGLPGGMAGAIYALIEFLKYLGAQ